MMKKSKLFFLGSLLTAVSCTNPTGFSKLVDENDNFDILIANGSIVDGTGKQSYRADVLLRADTIAYIGAVDSTQIAVGSYIDASGKFVAPGFIDVHAHGNPLSGTPFNNFLRMGVTTIVLGQDGSHPTSSSDGSKVGLLEWMDELELQKPALNVAMLAGHATLRREAGVSFADESTAAQLEEMSSSLKEALQAGCYGISTGLEYVGGMSATEDELIALAKVVGSSEGIMMSHVRNEDDDKVEDSIEELLNLGEHCKVHVSHMKVVFGKGKIRANEILEQLADARANGVAVSADVYPYLASYTTIGIVFPQWAKTRDQFEKAKRTRKKELETYLFNRVTQRNGPEATLLAGNEYAGKTLQAAASELDISFVELLMQIGPDGGSGAYFIMEDSLMSTFLVHPETMISSDGSPTMRHPRGHGTFARIIERYVVERKQLTLEEAVRKMTGLPAETLGIAKRGKLAVGNAADIIAFDPANVREVATYIDPYQLSEGIDHVIVNGLEVIRDGSSLNNNAGALLRKTQ